MTAIKLCIYKAKTLTVKQHRTVSSFITSHTESKRSLKANSAQIKRLSYKYMGSWLQYGLDIIHY